MSVLKYVILCLLVVTFSDVSNAQTVKIDKAGTGWTLTRNGRPYYIKGVVGDTFLEKVGGHGGNSVRMSWNRADLDKAQSLGLSVLVNLPFNAERYGMDYNDQDSVARQKARVLEIVRRTRDHPALLAWAIGNELDYIPGSKPFNTKLWAAVNDLAKAIHEIDPDHPVMTVIGTSRIEKIADISRECTALDLLGINTYGDIYTMSQTLRKYGWQKPYVYTEWGPDGYWEVIKTPWRAPYEQTPKEKYDCYEQKYRRAILGDPDNCLGSYVFYWSGDKQETTHTWFTLFDSSGVETPIVGLMQQLWTGNVVADKGPIVDSINIDAHVRYSPIYLRSDSIYMARAAVSSSKTDGLNYRWEVRPEAVYAAYAGQGEQKPLPMDGLIVGQGADAKFHAPAKTGAYRLFVYVYDRSGHFSSANLPFFVK